MANPVSRLALAGLVVARLSAISTATVYAGEVPGQPPVIPGQTRVRPYAVVFSGDGTPIDEAPLTADVTGSLTWAFQVTCAAGYHDDTLALLDAVHGQLDGWIPTLTGYLFAPIGQPPGYDAGPVRIDRTVESPRFYLPAQFVLPVTRFA
jgi:hypothetical protein